MFARLEQDKFIGKKRRHLSPSDDCSRNVFAFKWMAEIIGRAIVVFAQYCLTLNVFIINYLHDSHVLHPFCTRFPRSFVAIALKFTNRLPKTVAPPWTLSSKLIFDINIGAWVVGSRVDSSACAPFHIERVNRFCHESFGTGALAFSKTCKINNKSLADFSKHNKFFVVLLSVNGNGTQQIVLCAHKEANVQRDVLAAIRQTSAVGESAERTKVKYTHTHTNTSIDGANKECWAATKTKMKNV